MDDDAETEPSLEPSPGYCPSPNVLMKFRDEQIVHKIMELDGRAHGGISEDSSYRAGVF